MLFGLFRKKTALSGKPRRRPLQRRRLSIDRLEDRQLLSVTTPGTEFQVPTAATGVQFTNGRSVAMDANGDTVVAWADSQNTTNGLPTGPFGLEFQLYTNNAGALTAGTGGPVETMSGSPVTSNWLKPEGIDDNLVPQIVMVARAPTSGNFVVAWQTQNRVGSYIEYATYAQVYDAAGSPRTNPVLVGGSGDNLLEAVAMNDNGFDVLYGANTVKGKYPPNNQATTVERFSSTGVAEGSPVNVVTPQNGGGSGAISMDPKGNFVVAWDDIEGSSPNYVHTIDAERYTSSGRASGSVIQVFASANNVDGPSVAMDSADDFVVSWWGNAALTAETVYANNSLGAANVVDGSAYPSGNQPATIAMQANGNYALSWVDRTSSSFTIYGDTYLLSGAQQQSPFEVYSTSNLNDVQFAAAAVDANGDMLVIYSGYGHDPNYTTIYTDGGVFGQFYVNSNS